LHVPDPLFWIAANCIPLTSGGRNAAVLCVGLQRRRRRDGEPVAPRAGHTVGRCRRRYWGLEFLTLLLGPRSLLLTAIVMLAFLIYNV
jgi:hypothetical protein